MADRPNTPARTEPTPTVPKLVQQLRPLQPMVQILRPRIPEIRKLKIGRKSDQTYTARSGTEYRRPVKLDHFLVTKTTRYDLDDDENFEVDEAVMKELAQFADGDGHVRQLPVRVGSDDVTEVVHSELACYSGQTKVCWGDGTRAFRRLPVVQNGRKFYSKEVEERTCPCKLLTTGKCKYKGRVIMKLDLPGLAMSGGAMIFRTTSQISLDETYGSLMDIINDVGGLHGYRLWCVLRQARVAPEGVPTDVYVIHFENREPNLRALQQIVIDARVVREQVRGTIDYKALVAATNEETPLESAEIAAEFYPDAIDEEPHDIETGEVPERKATSTQPAPVPAPAPTTTTTTETTTRGRGRKTAQAQPAAAADPAAAAAAGGVELDESMREYYRLRDEQERKASVEGKNVDEVRDNREQAREAGVDAHATGSEPAREREPGDDDDEMPVSPVLGIQTTSVPEDEGGQRKLIDEPKPSEPPRQGNASMRAKLGGGK